jgi:hypothetical protein
MIRVIARILTIAMRHEYPACAGNGETPIG